MKQQWQAMTPAMRWVTVLTPLLLVVIPPIVSSFLTRGSIEDAHDVQIEAIRRELDQIREDYQNSHNQLREDIRELWRSGQLGSDIRVPTSLRTQDGN